MNKSELLYGFQTFRRQARQSPKQVEAKQEKALRKLLSFAYAHSPFYREKYQKAGIREEDIASLPFSSFPVTDKDEVMANYPRVLTGEKFTQEELYAFDASEEKGLFHGRYHVVHSSGSTGTPRYFIYDEKAWNQVIFAGARSLFWDMALPEIVSLISRPINILYVAVSGSRFGGAMMVDAFSKIVAAKTLCLDVNEPLAHWKEKVADFHPTFIAGYPSALCIMTKELEKDGVALPTQKLISCGEVLSFQQRKYLEGFYRVPVTNFYAATESLALGVETRAEEGMFLFDDMNLIEVVEGKMYLTSLYNYAQPLIRYRISDEIELVQPLGEECGFTRCKMKQGRAEDILWFEDGAGRRDFLHPTILEDFCWEGLLRYQFIQESKTAFRVEIETAPGADGSSIAESLGQSIRALLVAHGMEFVAFRVVPVEHIYPEAKSGKFRLCIALK